MELNAEQIKKALKCCTSPDGDDTCLLCPYGDVGLCTQLVMAHALALIKQLTEEKERLRAENAEQDKAIINALNRMGDIRREAKADTVREMQERIKTRCIKSGIYPAIVARAIDQIAKEMTEGDDA